MARAKKKTFTFHDPVTGQSREVPIELEEIPTDPRKGIKRSREVKERISASLKARPKMKCEHCGKECSANLYSRWHGDNCKTLGKRYPIIRSQETKERIRAAYKARPKIKCKHCHNQYSTYNHERFHGDNCKHRH